MKSTELLFVLVGFLGMCSAMNNVQEGPKILGGRQRRQLYVKPVMQSLHISSVITSRFSDVIMVSKVINKESVAQKVIYQAQLPKTAFISNFSMIIDGKTYVGVVKKTEVAVSEFSESVERGETVGLIKTTGRETQWFEVSVNIAADSDVIFNLRYQELLIRKLGKYEHVIFADIQKGIEDFELDVYISEPTGIKDLQANKPYKDSTINAKEDENFQVIVRKSSVQAQVSYRTSSVQFEEEGEHSRRFVVRYDAERGSSKGGDLQVYDNCFAHFFAPNLPSMRKRIIFAIDVSGSMRGDKIRQTKNAFKSILAEVQDVDEFNIVTFSGSVRTWKKSLLSMGSDGVKDSALQFVNNLHTGGSTNLFGALDTALRVLNLSEKEVDELGEQTVTDMIIILTDGNPTTGLVNSDKIVTATLEKNKNEIPIFCLGFGNDVDHDFLRKLAHQNHGRARRIYVDSDSELQLKGFYNEVSSPLLSGVTVSIPKNISNEVTLNEFDTYFKGSELVVMGKLSSEIDAGFNVVVNGKGQGGEFERTASRSMIEREFSFPVAEGIENRTEMFCERMWAYLTITQLLKKKESNDMSPNEEYDQRILQLALKFNFVTPLTSMIARKPNNVTETANVEEKEPIKKSPSPRPQVPLLYPPRRNRHRDRPQSTGFQPRIMLTSAHHPAGGRRFARIFSRKGPSRKMKKMYSSSRILDSGPMRFNRRNRVSKQFLTTTTTTPQPTTTQPTTTTVPITVTYPRFPDLNIAPTCGEDHELSVSGNTTISSPSYPHMYHANTICRWVISSTVPFILQFQSFDLEEGQNGYCLYDRVIMYFDEKVKAKAICGGKLPGRKFRIKKKMTIIFQSDNAVQGMGFQAVAFADLNA